MQEKRSAEEWYEWLLERPDDVLTKLVRSFQTNRLEMHAESPELAKAYEQVIQETKK